MGYFVHKGFYLVFDINKKIFIKKQDITFFKHVYGHLSLSNYEVSQGCIILEEKFNIVFFDTPEFITKEYG